MTYWVEFQLNKSYVKIVVMTIDGSDSLVPVERKNQNSSAGKWTWDLLIKLQVLYQLSYQGIHALSPPQDWSQSSDHMLCTVCPYRLVTYDLWFEGLPPCIKVHLDCLAAYVKIVIMTIDGSDSLVPVERKNHNSSARKQTRDLLIKLQVLYQLSYQGIHALSLHKTGHSHNKSCSKKFWGQGQRRNNHCYSEIYRSKFYIWTLSWFGQSNHRDTMVRNHWRLSSAQ